MKKILGWILVVAVFIVAAPVAWAVEIKGDMDYYNITVRNLIRRPYKVTASITWDFAKHGNVAITSGGAASVITIPLITQDNSGMLFTLKNESGTVNRYVYPVGGTDKIEVDQGTITGVSDHEVNSAGETKTWIGVYKDDLASTNSVWLLLTENTTD